MKCYKCGLFTKVWQVTDDDRLPMCLCGSCAIKFIQQLCLWKDIDLRAELEYWKTGLINYDT